MTRTRRPGRLVALGRVQHPCFDDETEQGAGDAGGARLPSGAVQSRTDSADPAMATMPTPGA
jgi:hypothetical protein